MFTLNQLAARVGIRNARILMERYLRHRAGLELMVQPMDGRTRHKTGKPRNKYLPADTYDGMSFLDRMKDIEQSHVHIPGTKKGK